MIFETELQGFSGRIVRYCIVRKNEAEIDYNAINNDKSVSFVAIDGDMVYGINHLLVACMKAINREETGKKFISGDLNREIIYSFSPGKNLKDALALFAAKEDTSLILLASLTETDGLRKFVTDKGLITEESVDCLESCKPEEKKRLIIKHYGITEQELNIYPLKDLLQMGVGMKNV